MYTHKSRLNNRTIKYERELEIGIGVIYYIPTTTGAGRKSAIEIQSRHVIRYYTYYTCSPSSSERGNKGEIVFVHARGGGGSFPSKCEVVRFANRLGVHILSACRDLVVQYYYYDNVD